MNEGCRVKGDSHFIEHKCVNSYVLLTPMFGRCISGGWLIGPRPLGQGPNYLVYIVVLIFYKRMRIMRERGMLCIGKCYL